MVDQDCFLSHVVNERVVSEIALNWREYLQLELFLQQLRGENKNVQC